MVNEGDRGVLFTRGYYDIRPEPPTTKPVPREVDVLARGGAKKLSLSDYAKKKSGAAASASPSDPPTPSSQKKSSDKPPSTTEPRSLDEPKSSRDPKRPDNSRSMNSESHSSARSSKTATNEVVVVDTSLPPRPPSLPARPPDPDRRKRPAETDDGARPLKRQRPSDATRAPEEPSREDPLRRKAQDYPSSRNHTPVKDSRLSGSNSLLNGRGTVKVATSQPRNTSPPPRSRGNSMNGVRPPTTGANRTSSSKLDVGSKTYVPPLLSPLHLDINDGTEDTGRGAQKKRASGVESGKVPKSKNIDVHIGPRPPRSPVKIPPLLSPTLPPEVEAELERRRKLSPRPLESRSREEPEIEKRIRVDPDDEGRGRRTHLVTLRVPRTLRTRFAGLMRLPPSRKEPRLLGPTSSSHGEKRPVGLTDVHVESIAMKKPRASDVPNTSKPSIPPSTPSYRKGGATNMSRVSSSNSLVNTPGEAITGTPSVPGSSERTTNGPEPLSKSMMSKITLLREKEIYLRSLGKRLKHNGDLALNGRQDTQAAVTNGNTRAGEPNTKLGYVLHLEGTLAFMMSFYVQDLHRTLASKAADPGSWGSLLPLLDFLRRKEGRVLRPLHAVTMLLQVIAYDEITKAYTTQDNPKDVTLQEFLKHRRTREKIIPQLREYNASIDSSFRANITLLTTVEDIAEVVLGILRRWCADEGIDYNVQLNLREVGVKNIMARAHH